MENELVRKLSLLQNESFVIASHLFTKILLGMQGISVCRKIEQIDW